jgi:hypothetical protein
LAAIAASASAVAQRTQRVLDRIPRRLLDANRA